MSTSMLQSIGLVRKWTRRSTSYTYSHFFLESKKRQTDCNYCIKLIYDKCSKSFLIIVDSILHLFRKVVPPSRLIFFSTIWLSWYVFYSTWFLLRFKLSVGWNSEISLIFCLNDSTFLITHLYKQLFFLLEDIGFFEIQSMPFRLYLRNLVFKRLKFLCLLSQLCLCITQSSHQWIILVLNLFHLD